MQNVEYAQVQQALDRLKGLSADAETQGTLTQLDIWADRMLNAPTLDALIAAH